MLHSGERERMNGSALISCQIGGLTWAQDLLPPHGFRHTIAIGIGSCVAWRMRGVIRSSEVKSGALPLVSGWIVVSCIIKCWTRQKADELTQMSSHCVHPAF